MVFHFNDPVVRRIIYGRTESKFPSLPWLLSPNDYTLSTCVDVGLRCWVAVAMYEILMKNRRVRLGRRRRPIRRRRRYIYRREERMIASFDQNTAVGRGGGVVIYKVSAAAAAATYQTTLYRTIIIADFMYRLLPCV